MKLKLKKLNEQVIVITGASSGIGLTTARMAARRGARLVLAARSEGDLDELVRELRAEGHEAAAVYADVGSEPDVQRIAAEAMRLFGGFDTWVNNAGVSIYGRFLDVSVTVLHRLFETNFWAWSTDRESHLNTCGSAAVRSSMSVAKSRTKRCRCR
jgi:NAD(P)-dependent dehydrogenase (short-subunit alcohol dehydrogenase family)